MEEEEGAGGVFVKQEGEAGGVVEGCAGADPHSVALSLAAETLQTRKSKRQAARNRIARANEAAARSALNGRNGKGDDLFKAAVDYFIAADEMEARAEMTKVRRKTPRKQTASRVRLPGERGNGGVYLGRKPKQEPKKRGRGREPSNALNPAKSARKQRAGKKAGLENEGVLRVIEDADGMKHTLGAHVGRMKVFDKVGRQITKSCHQCQEQHIAWKCNSEYHCNASYCLRCIGNWYPGWTVAELEASCPRCRGICNCRACLRKTSHPVDPEFSPPQRLEYAMHMLRVSGPHVKAFLEAEEAEAKCDGKTLDSTGNGDRVQTINMSGSMRVSCDVCATSIPNLYRTCQSCQTNWCILCCQHARKKAGSSQVSCPNCDQPMELQMLMSSNVLELLRCVAKEYGDWTGPSYWKWLGSNDVKETSSKKRSSGNSGNWLMAAERPDGKQNYIFCPNAEDFDQNSPNRAAAVRQFQDCMRAGEPVLIRGLKPKINWGPETMYRACVDRGNKQLKAEPKSCNVTVIDCTNKWQTEEMHQRIFFNYYETMNSKRQLKVMDWPPSEGFADRLKRHNQDFLEMLPLPEYMHPALGPLNTYRSLPSRWLPPDIGPKTYVATGRVEEHGEEGDSVTKLHMDMSDTINVLCHAQYTPVEAKHIHIRHGDETWDKPTYGNAGAVWDIVRRVDVPKVRKYLFDRKDQFIHKGRPISEQRMVDPYHDQMFMLTEHDRKELKEVHDVHVWHFEQHVWEAVYIPSGCPHQVRNLRPCLKTALDFVPPESFRMIKNLKGVNHLIGRHEKSRHADVLSRNGADKLQGTAMLLHAAKEAYCKVTQCVKPYGGSYMATVSSRAPLTAGRRGRYGRGGRGSSRGH